MTTRPLGLTQALSAALREHTTRVLDLLLAEVRETFQGDPDAVERDLVDEVRRWAERREEALFPGGRWPDHEHEAARVATGGAFRFEVCLCGAVRSADEKGPWDEPDPIVEHEPTNGHGKAVPEEEE